MGFREDLDENRGATSDAINALGTYRFRSKKPRNGEGNEGGGGVFAPGTDKERAVSAEDAVRFSRALMFYFAAIYIYISWLLAHDVKLTRVFWLGRFAVSAWRGTWITMISGCSLAGTSSTRTVSTNGSR